MALEKREEKVRAKREEEEADLVHNVLLESLRSVQSHLQKIDKAIDFNEDNPRKLAILTNARARQQQQLFFCVALLRDPKLRLTSENGRTKDFARMMEGALLQDNPASAKLVKEAEAREGSSSKNNDSLGAPDSLEKNQEKDEKEVV